MRKIDRLFNEYSESHQNEMNKLIHWICVPLILWSILGFISLTPAPHFYLQNFGAISIVSLAALIIISIFYFTLSWGLAAMMIFILLVFEHLIYLVNITFERNSWIIFLSVFVLSWIGQFYGHKIEGKKPSFLKDLQFLLVGPIWLLHFLIKKANIKY